MPASPILDLPPPLAIVCHDAGAANLVFAWMLSAIAERPSSPLEWRLHLSGPAARIWSDLGEMRVQCLSTLEQALNGATTLLSGTGWASDLEHRARSLAAQRGMMSIAVIDHWVNYLARFERDGELVLPNAIWVTDDYAVEIAGRIFPYIPVFAQPNLYLAAQLADIMPPPAKPFTVLYIAEPIRNYWGSDTPGEFQALDFFIAGLPLLGVPEDLKLLFRIHPSETDKKYDKWIAANASLNIEIDQSVHISEAISQAHIVAGCESQALVLALSAGRRVVSAIPPWAPASRLPHRGLIYLKDIIALS